MSSVADIVDSIYPSSNSVGALLSVPIFVVFDREIDEFSVNDGNLFIEGPDTDTVIGPDVGLLLPNISDSGSNDQFASPGYKGIVQGTITFEKIMNTSSDIYSGFDYTGTGSIWRTKAIFTPTNALQKLTKYTVYLVGDEDLTDGISTGIRARSIFDTVKGSNLGNGDLVFVGTFEGLAVSDTFNIKITADGAAGEAWFNWWRTSDPSLIFGPIRTEQIQNILLEEGVYANFGEGSFSTNDTFSAVVKKPTLFTGNTNWSFDTGTGSIETLPTSTSTSITGDLVTSLTPTTSLQVTSILPDNLSTNLPLTTNRIVIQFNSNIDPSTVTSETITIMGLPVNGDENLFSPKELYKDITVSGNQIILDI